MRREARSPSVGARPDGRPSFLAAPVAAILLAAPLAGCSLVTGVAVNSLAAVLAEGEAVYRSDDDLELVGSALAFNLKTVESLLLQEPEHRLMLLAAAKGFALYAYAFVEPDLFELDFTQFEEEQAIRARAARLYERSREFGLRGLEVNHPGIAERLSLDPWAAAAELEADDASLALWTGTATGAWIAMNTADPEATADLSVMGALLERVLELDDTTDDGVAYDYLSLYEAIRPGGSIERARELWERALEFGDERLPVLWSSWAETGSTVTGDRAEFVELLERSLEYDIHSRPEGRLLNRVAQQRSAWLLSRIDDYFLEGNE